MFLKTLCPHCKAPAFNDVVGKMIETQTGWIIEELDVRDTVPEEDILMMISDFVSKNGIDEILQYGFKDILTKGFNISPLFTDDLIAKFKSKKSNH